MNIYTVEPNGHKIQPYTVMCTPPMRQVQMGGELVQPRDYIAQFCYSREAAEAWVLATVEQERKAQEVQACKA